MTTGLIIPWIDRIPRRVLLLSGAVLCMALHFATAGLMATYGEPVDSVDGNANLRWEIHGTAAKGVIACSYIVCLNPHISLKPHIRVPTSIGYHPWFC